MSNEAVTNGQTTAGAFFSARPIIDQVKFVLQNPKTCWAEIARDPVEPIDLYSRFIAKFGAIKPIFEVIGLSLVGTSIPEVARIALPNMPSTYRTGFFGQIFSSTIIFAISLGVMYLCAKLVVWLAPKFQGKTSVASALKLICYSSIPSVLSSVFHLVPSTGLKMLGSLLGLFSIYLFVQGVPHLTTVPNERKVGFIVTLIILSIAISFFLGLIFAGLGLVTVLS